MNGKVQLISRKNFKFTKFFPFSLGEWSDKHENWNKVDEETRHKIGLRYKADGEFWMDYFKDFVHEFEEVSICTMGPDFDHDGQVDNAQCTITLHGSWIANVNAGGCRNNFELFATNPKYKLSVMHETNQVSKKHFHEYFEIHNSNIFLIFFISGYCQFSTKKSSWK